MLLLILFIAIVFTITAFVIPLPITSSSHSFFSFLLYQLQVILNHSILFTILSLIVVIALFRLISFEKKHPFHTKSLVTLVYLVTVSIIGVFTSYLLLLLIAWIQLTLSAVLINTNPYVLGIQTQRKEIITTLKNDDIPPQIRATDDTAYNKLVSVTQAISGIDNFYGSTILPSIPSFLLPKASDLGQSIFLDNTLIIANVNKTELETLSPIVGYMFIKHYFPERAIKFYPKIVVIDDKEYEGYRVIDSKEKSKTLDKQIAEIDDAISSTSASLTKMKASIASNQALIPQTYAQKDAQMKKCNAAGHYVSNVFKHDNTPEFCRSQASSFDTTVDKANKEVDETTKKLPAVENQLKLYEQYKTFFTSQRKLNAVLDKNIPHELGVFKPPSTIRILIDQKSSHALADYFATTVHEYLHYASAQPNKSFSILFFEEGLTEYFARHIIKDNLNTSTNLGYPIFAKIIAQMSKAIPESDLADIYFTKDQAKLETTLDNVYGTNFYKNNALLFTTLQYASDPKQILTLANTIMKKIGGVPLTMQDIFSTESKL